MNNNKIKIEPTILDVITHEIKNPIINILYHLDSIETSIYNLNTLNKQIHLIRKSCNSLLDLTNKYHNNQLLHVSNIKPKFELFLLLDHIKEIIDNQKTISNNKNINLKLKYDNSIPLHVIGDKVLISQLLYNLINNSIKYSNHSNPIIIKLNLLNKTSQKITIKFEITNKGIGIKNKEKELIFQPFYQSDISKEGSGIGLYICKIICEKLSAKLYYKQNDIKGTIFAFEIPFLLANKNNIHPSLTHSNMKKSKQNKISKERELSIHKILIIEDDEIQQHFSKKLLQELFPLSSIHITTQKNLNKHADKNLDLIIIDLYSTHLDVNSIIYSIKNLFDLNKTIITSATKNKELIAKLKSIGFKSFIQKPLTKNSLVNIINLQHKIDDNTSLKEKNFNKIIDWNLAITRANNDVLLAFDLYNKFIKALPEINKKIIKSFEQKSFEKLSSLLHYLKGGF